MVLRGLSLTTSADFDSEKFLLLQEKFSCGGADGTWKQNTDGIPKPIKSRTAIGADKCVDDR